MVGETLTPEEIGRIGDFLEGRYLTVGLGDVDAACSVASINLALTGALTDEIPKCMSLVVGRWIIGMQNAMPDELRNGEWKRLLPFAAGTGQDREEERLAIMLDHMWGVVLPLLQPLADRRGFGVEWAEMCRERTPDAASAAWAAAAWDAAAAASAASAAHASAAAWAAAAAASAAEAWGAASGALWRAIDPVAVLERLIK